jgi:hypothetical protein
MPGAKTRAENRVLKSNDEQPRRCRTSIPPDYYIINQGARMSEAKCGIVDQPSRCPGCRFAHPGYLLLDYYIRSRIQAKPGPLLDFLAFAQRRPLPKVGEMKGQRDRA